MSKTISEKPVSLVSKVVQSITLATFSKVASDKLLLAKYIKDSVFFCGFYISASFCWIVDDGRKFCSSHIGGEMDSSY